MLESEIIELAKIYDVGVFTDQYSMNKEELLAFATEIRNRTLDEAAGVIDEHSSAKDGWDVWDTDSPLYVRADILALKGDEK